MQERLEIRKKKKKKKKKQMMQMNSAASLCLEHISFSFARKGHLLNACSRGHAFQIMYKFPAAWGWGPTSLR